MTRAAKPKETVVVPPPRPSPHQLIIDVLDELAALEDVLRTAEQRHKAKYGTSESGAAWRALSIARAARDQGTKNVCHAMVESHYVDAHIRFINAEGERRGEAYGRAEAAKEGARAASHEYERGVKAGEAAERRKHDAKGWPS